MPVVHQRRLDATRSPSRRRRRRRPRCRVRRRRPGSARGHR